MLDESVAKALCGINFSKTERPSDEHNAAVDAMVERYANGVCIWTGAPLSPADKRSREKLEEEADRQANYTGKKRGRKAKPKLTVDDV